MKKTMLTGLALILVLIFTAAAALAEAPSEWRIQDYVRLWQDGTIPESFDSGYTGGPETVVGGVRFRVTDVYATFTHAVILTEVSMADGSPALFTMGLQDPAEEKLAWYLYDAPEEDPRSLQDYADEKQLPVVFVESWPQVGNSLHWGVDQWIADEYRTILAADIYYGPNTAQELSFDWEFFVFPSDVLEHVGDGDVSKLGGANQTIHVTLPLAKEVTETLSAGQEVSSPFGPIRLDKAVIHRSAAETVLNLTWSLAVDGNTAREDLEDYRFLPLSPAGAKSWTVPEVYSDVRKHDSAIDPESGRYVCFQTCSLALSPEEDTLRLSFYGQSEHPDDREVLTFSIPKAE